MKRSTLTRTLGLLLLVTLSFGCKTKKKTTTDALKKLDASSILAMIQNQNLDYDYLEASGTAIVKSPQLNVTGNFLLRLQKDNTVWMRVQKFGFEAVRMLIQNDTLSLLSRLDKSYQQMSLNEASKLTHLRLSQEQIVDMMAGCAIVDDASFISLNQDSLMYSYKLGFDDFYATHTVDLSNELVVGSEFMDMSERTLLVDHSDFKYLDSLQMVSYERTFQISGVDELGESSITLKFKEIELTNALSFPFEIPSHYTRRY